MSADRDATSPRSSAATRAVVLVLGGGPAGLSAALWLHRYGLRPVLIERAARVGGWLATTPYANATVLGHPGVTSQQLAQRYREHLEVEGVATVRAEVTRATVNSDGVSVELSSGGVLRGRALVLATGTRLRTLEVPGAEDARRSGRLLYLTEGGLEQACGKRVAVIGGGDNACFMALELAGLALEVTLLVRGELRAQRLLRQQVLASDQVRIAHATAQSLGDGVVRCESLGKQLDVAADVVYAMLGYVPNSEQVRGWLPNLELDQAGYLAVDGDCRTSVPGVWAVGDVCNPRHPCVATALAHGTMAARDIEAALDRGLRSWRS